MRRFINYFKNLKPQFHEMMTNSGSPGVVGYGYTRCLGTGVHLALRGRGSLGVVGQGFNMH